ncbi:MAG TPA: winged helix-turn-helix domain-containing protein [Caulobacteraceae bacterium]|nr:winged helix-turn-helix domain-containing protein [Caulobacteraceae bacterium]
MHDGPVIATIAALIGDPARANMLTALMDGRALTVSELAQAAGVALQTASGHLSKLEAAGLTTAERHGRNRYVRLTGPDVGHALEALMSLAERTGARRVRTGPRDPALRTARVCYDHLAGELGVALMRGLTRQGLITDEPEPAVTPSGILFFANLGVDVPSLAAGRRPVCRRCLDWSERRDHLGGALGAGLLSAVTKRGWAQRAEGRTLAFTPAGLREFAQTFALAG